MARDIISEFVFIAESKHVACQIVVIYFSWREAETHHTLVPGFVDSREKPGTTEITDPRTQYLVLNEEPSCASDHAARASYSPWMKLQVGTHALRLRRGG